ncbi:MAG: hypothetical protein HYX92_05240 [Chloroflexi bacterium]|nr:hypothetical protein [Chloroflexota bacterium]
MRRFIAPLAVVVSSILAFAVPWLLSLNFNDDGSRLQASFVGVLVVVTAYYAYQTREQANASVRMVEQQLFASCPIVVPRILNVGWDNIMAYPAVAHVRLDNFGPGVAFDVEVAVMDNCYPFDPITFKTMPTLCVVPSGDKRDLEFKLQPGSKPKGWESYSEHQPYIEVRYKSACGVKAVARLALIAEVKNDRIAFTRGGTAFDFAL